MKKLRIIMLLLSFSWIFLLSSCGSSNTPESEESSSGGDTSKVVYDYEYDLYNKDVDEIIEQVETKVKGYKGYVKSSKNYDDEYTRIVYKVPSGDVELFTKFIESFDKITSKIMSTENVDSEYSSILSDIETLEVTKAAYNAILEEYGDELSADKQAALKQEIIEIDEQIAALNKQKSAMDEQVNYSTVTVDYYAQSYSTGSISIGSTLGIVILLSLPFGAVAGLIYLVTILSQRRKENKIEE